MEGKRSRNMEGHINYILHIKEEYSIFGEACSSDIPLVVTLSSGLQKGSMSFPVLEHDACGKRIVQSYSKPPRIAPSLQVSSKTKILAKTNKATQISRANNIRPSVATCLLPRFRCCQFATAAAIFVLFDDGISCRWGCHEFQQAANWSITTKKFAI
jgi:hypothetical protein